MRQLEIRPGVRITNDKCLILDEGPTVVIGDLHLGYERAMEQDGLYLPRLNTETIGREINNILSEYEPEKVVLLGDVKHEFRRAGYEEREQVRRIVEMIAEESQVVIVKGNHDNYIQNIVADLGILTVSHVDIMGYRLEHGHEDSGVRPVIIGHEHPSVRFPNGSGGMKILCFVHAENEGVIVIPPFSPYSSGNNLSPNEDCVMAPALRSSDYAEARIYGISDIGLLDLGTLRSISDFRFRDGTYLH